MAETSDMIDRKGVSYLPEDNYRFLGRELRVRSDSPWALDCLRSAYDRFYSGSDGDPPVPGDTAHRAGVPLLEIVDRTDGDGELQLQDDRWFYRATSGKGPGRFTRQERQSPETIYEGFCGPRDVVRAALLDTVSRSVEGWNLFHGGSLSRNGEGILLVGDSEAGKTTLTLALVGRGCRFLSDEVVCMHAEDARLEPFPRRLNLRRESRRLLGLELLDDDEVTVDVEELFPGRVSGPCTPGLLLFLGGFADEPHLEVLARSNALFKLFDFAIGAVPDPAELMFRYVPLLERMRCYNLVLGPLGETCDLVMGVAEEHPGS
jgi:hypothetical protein